jgi:hypothetical protein
MDGIGLSDAIDMLRAEIVDAQAKAAQADVHFPIQTLTVEFKVGLTKKGEAKAGFKVPFFGAEVGASGGLSQETTHVVTLALGPPTDSSGKQISITQISKKKLG